MGANSTCFGELLPNLGETAIEGDGGFKAGFLFVVFFLITIPKRRDETKKRIEAGSRRSFIMAPCRIVICSYQARSQDPHRKGSSFRDLRAEAGDKEEGTNYEGENKQEEVNYQGREQRRKDRDCSSERGTIGGRLCFDDW